MLVRHTCEFFRRFFDFSAVIRCAMTAEWQHAFLRIDVSNFASNAIYSPYPPPNGTFVRLLFSFSFVHIEMMYFASGRQININMQFIRRLKWKIKRCRTENDTKSFYFSVLRLNKNISNSINNFCFSFFALTAAVSVPFVIQFFVISCEYLFFVSQLR